MHVTFHVVLPRKRLKYLQIPKKTHHILCGFIYMQLIGRWVSCSPSPPRSISSVQFTENIKQAAQNNLPKQCLTATWVNEATGRPWSWGDTRLLPSGVSFGGFLLSLDPFEGTSSALWFCSITLQIQSDLLKRRQISSISSSRSFLMDSHPQLIVLPEK